MPLIPPTGLMNIKWEAKEYAENFGFVPQYGKNVFKLPMWIKILIFASHLHIIVRNKKAV